MNAKTCAAIVKDLAALYTVDTDQIAVIALSHRARAAAAVAPTRPGLRSESELAQVVVERMTDELSQFLFARRAKDLAPAQRLDLLQQVGELVQSSIDEHCPEEDEPTEPCAMSAAKYEAES